MKRNYQKFISYPYYKSVSKNGRLCHKLNFNKINFSRLLMVTPKYNVAKHLTSTEM